MAFLTDKQLSSLGLKSYGKDVLISEKASIYGAAEINIGSNVRIDDFSVLSAGKGGIDIGSNVHIATQCSLIGDEKISLENFVGISAKVSIFSSSDDYMGYGLTNPTIPDKYKRVHSSTVRLQKHVLIGANSVILPGCLIGEGVSVGALSLVNKSLDEWRLYSGNPIKSLVRRSKKMLEYELLFHQEENKV